MALELVTPLPPGAPSLTRLARHGTRLVVLREIKDGTDCSWPPPAEGMVTLQEVGELQGKRHALFEFVPGVTLRELIHALELLGNPIPLGLVARVVVDAAKSIDAISPARTHGGLNDGALQIGFDGKVSVLDFGAPRVSRFRPIGRVNFAADVFAMGAVVHACLTGFQGEYAKSLGTLPAPSTSHAEATPALDDVVMRALSQQPDARQRDVGTFGDELEAVVGPLLFTHDKLSEVVQTLFKDRIKLLQSLGGLVNTTSKPDLEAELPMPGIPAGTQPGIGGPKALIPGDDPSEPTNPRASPKEMLPTPRATAPKPKPPKEMVPWDSNPSVETVEPASEPTLPRVNSSDAVPRAAPVPSAVKSINLTPADDMPDEDERTAAISKAELVKAQEAKLRASAPPVEETKPRAPALDSNDNTGETPVAPPDDTAPRARPKLTRDDPLVGPRNTTEAERLRARGQERLRTPPAGVPAADDYDSDDEPILTEPTNVKPRPRPSAAMTAQTSASLPPAMDEDEPVDDEQETPSGGGARRWVLRLMLLVVAALMVGVFLKIKKAQELAQQTDAVVDAGEVEDDSGEDAGAAPVALAGTVDAGDDDKLDGGDELDGGDDEEDDAGVEDAGSVGPSDAGTAKADAGKAPVKKAPVKKVKKKKRRH